MKRKKNLQRNEAGSRGVQHFVCVLGSCFLAPEGTQLEFMRFS